ncbi:uncharacterized protein LOC144713129 [Wolffia australiana]
MERVNSMIEEYLRHYVSVNKENWVELLDPELGYGSLASGSCEKERESREALERAAQRMKKYADQHRRDVEFQVGDKVLLKTNAPMLKTKQARQRQKGLVPRYDGPFEVVAKIGRVAYRLNIPRQLAVHPVFHVSVVKKYIPDPEDAARNQPQRAPPNVRAHFDQEAKAVLAKREIDRGGRHGCYHKIEYLTKWKNRPEESATWERDSDLWQFENLLQAYEVKQRASTRASASSGGVGVLGPSLSGIPYPEACVLIGRACSLYIGSRHFKD